MAILLLRHATAGHRSQWKGDDELRPLDKRGRRQAERLVESLAAYAPTRIVSSPYVRCVQTVEPLAAKLELPVEERDELGEEGAGPTAVRALLVELREETPVVCTHGDVILDLVGWERVAKKGSTWILEPDGDGFAPAVYLPPPTK
jgi:8-oxo-dGTP diphosphatase